eukprot:1161934-Pelagomonas_calceolata.AAC.12
MEPKPTPHKLTFGNATSPAAVPGGPLRSASAISSTCNCRASSRRRVAKCLRRRKGKKESVYQGCQMSTKKEWREARKGGRTKVDKCLKGHAAACLLSEA